ncbi:MAG: Crp/Fnr family transcriptional regulator [Methyloglobulus sp.]|nr:Crp/Fnr family transcriptional regulator [Methyloglobulus sp.]
MDTTDLLKNNEFFSNLDESDLKSLAEKVSKRTYPKNTIVINVGDDSSSMYLIESGSLKVTVSNEDGKELILAILKAGDCFGELSLLDDKPRSASVVALEQCSLVVLHKAVFLQLLEQNPKVAMHVIRYLCLKIRFTNSIAQSLALMDVYARLRDYLYTLATPVEEGGEGTVAIPLTHKEIASRVGSGREVISRILKQLETGEYLAIDKKIITLKKKLPNGF